MTTVPSSDRVQVPGREAIPSRAGAASSMDDADLYRLVSESSPSGELVVSVDGTIVFANPEIEHQFGYARAALIGQSMDLLLPEQLRPAHQGHHLDFLRSPERRAMGAGRELYGR